MHVGDRVDVTIEAFPGAVLLELVDTSIVNVALPSLARGPRAARDPRAAHGPPGSLGISVLSYLLLAALFVLALPATWWIVRRPGAP